MKMSFAMSLGLLLLTAAGCWFGGTTKSPEGGTVTGDEGFSIAVPTSKTVTQGEEETIVVSLKRGAYFKRDVTLEINAKGINVTPDEVLIRASDASDVELTITSTKDTALGMYRVSVNATPETGNLTSTEFTVEVVAP